jgi:hypothetical protein
MNSKIVVPCKELKNELKYVDDTIHYDKLALLWEYINQVPYILSPIDERYPNKHIHRKMVHSSNSQTPLVYDLVTTLKNNWFYDDLLNHEFSSIKVIQHRPGEPSFVQTHHGERKILMVHCNLMWNSNWQGETKFYDINNQLLMWTTDFVPGRVVLVDGTVPYISNSSNSLAEEFRTTIEINMKPLDTN